ncbi:MAG: hypothetical protein K8R69_05680 [Deltaproteobacteria bacterium]|nr:hypothetical protein [Deltaproteobacteria bacterium]
MGSLHIHRDGRDYDIAAARVVPGAGRSALRELRQRGFTGPYSTSGGVYYLDTHDPDISAARRDLLNMQHDGIGRATFHN